VVIQQFNRLIKNKWVWGVFALTISALFLIPDEWVGRGGREASDDGGAGTLAGKKVSIAEFNAVHRDVVFELDREREAARSYNRPFKEPTFHEINRRTWQRLAALATAREMGLVANEASIVENIRRSPMFCAQDGGFRNAQYDRFLDYFKLTRPEYEARVGRGITLESLHLAVLNCGGWVAPAEVSSDLDDMTDRFAVRTVAFTDKDYAKVKVDDKAIEAYYKDNTNAVALPACKVVSYARVAADAPARLATFKIPEEEMKDYYEEHALDFGIAGTNGTKVTPEFAKVKGEIQRRLQLRASVDAYRRAFMDDVDEAADGSRTNCLEKIAAAEKLRIVTTRPFAVSAEYEARLGNLVTGLVVRAADIVRDCAGGAEGEIGFAEVARSLDPEDINSRYGVAVGSNCVYFVECKRSDAARVPALAEVKGVLAPDALADAQAKAFREAVNKVRALAVAKLVEGKPFDAKMFGDANVSTSIVFSAASYTPGQSMDLFYARDQIRKLTPGKLSDFVATTAHHGVLVYLEKRMPGVDALSRTTHAANVRGRRSQSELTGLGDWFKWNLARMGFTTTPQTAVEDAAAQQAAEDDEAANPQS